MHITGFVNGGREFPASDGALSRDLWTFNSRLRDGEIMKALGDLCIGVRMRTPNVIGKLLQKKTWS
jgi:hypothetical protein